MVFIIINVLKVRSAWQPFCLDSNDTIGKAIIAFPCHGEGGNQYWMMSKLGEIRSLFCFEYSGGRSQLGPKSRILTNNCYSQGGVQKWSVEDQTGLIKHQSGFCIEMGLDKVSIYMSECDRNNNRQVWKWKKREI